MFTPVALKIPEPTFKDPLVSSIINLEKMRDKEVGGDVAPIIFHQLKNLFQIVESLGSARIEGNRTTLSDYVQDKVEGNKKTQSFMEIKNIEDCISYIDCCFENKPDFDISERFIKELHALLTKDLTEEGSRTPGAYRQSNVQITKAQHTPPESLLVLDYMQELFHFIRSDVQYQDRLLKIAIAHHRFLWIHPFDNGNGRVARLLTYAMMKSNGFDRISLINPTAVFCSDRNRYFEALAQADTGTDEGLLFWCRYVLNGLEAELLKINQLLNKNFLNDKILYPTILYAKNNSLLKDDYFFVLNYSLKNVSFKPTDLRGVFDGKSDAQLMYIVKKMNEEGFLQKDPSSNRKYTISFNQPVLLRGIIEQLATAGFINNLQ